jgi:hypothetical protein
MIDVSTHQAQKAFFRGSYEQWGIAVADSAKFLPRAIANGEVHLMWRGRININMMEVVDPDNGNYQMPYIDALARDYFNHFGLGRISSKAPQRLSSLLETVIGNDDAIRIHLDHRDLLPRRASCKGSVIGARGKAPQPIKPQPAPYAKTEMTPPMPDRLPPGSPGAPPPTPLAWDPTPPPKPPAGVPKTLGSLALTLAHSQPASHSPMTSVDRDGRSPFKKQRKEATDKLTVATDGTPPVRGRSLFDTDINAREATPNEELEQLLLARSKVRSPRRSRKNSDSVGRWQGLGSAHHWPAASAAHWPPAHSVATCTLR